MQRGMRISKQAICLVLLRLSDLFASTDRQTTDNRIENQTRVNARCYGECGNKFCEPGQIYKIFLRDFEDLAAETQSNQDKSEGGIVLPIVPSLKMTSIRIGSLEVLETETSFFKTAQVWNQPIKPKTGCRMKILSFQVDAGSLTNIYCRNETGALLFGPFNEDNYADGKLIKELVLRNYKDWDTISRYIEACMGLLPDLNQWCRFLKFISSDSNSLYKEACCDNLIKALETFQVFEAIKKANKNLESIEKRLFLEICVLFSTTLAKMRKEGFRNNTSKTVESFLQYLFELFILLFPDLINGEDVQRDKEMCDLISLAYLGFVYIPTPSEFYNVHSVTYSYLEYLLEYFLHSMLGISSIFNSMEMLGGLNTEDKPNLHGVLNNSEGFMSRHFLLQKKMWIHFGCNAVEKLEETQIKPYLPIFWKALRNLVVLLGGDGMLITWESKKKEENENNKTLAEPAHTSETTDKPFEKVEIMRTAFWNFIDPTVEGSVVFFEGNKMEIVPARTSSTGSIYTLCLTVDGKNNFISANKLECPEMALFYEDRNKKGNETLESIKALPGSVYSKVFPLVDPTNREFPKEWIVSVCEQILKLNPFKVTLLFGGQPEQPTKRKEKASKSTKSKTDSPREFTPMPRYKNKTFAIEQICKALNKVSKLENSNLRELCLEIIGKDRIKNFEILLQKLKLTTFRYRHLSDKNDHIATYIYKAITKNKFMMEHLQYIDFFSSMWSSSIIEILRSAPLRKLTGVLYESNSIFLFHETLEILNKKRCLQEVELYLVNNLDIWEIILCDDDYTRAAKQLKAMPLSKLSIFGHNVICKRLLTDLSYNETGALSTLFSSLKSALFVCFTPVPQNRSSYLFSMNFDYSQENQAAELVSMLSRTVVDAIAQTNAFISYGMHSAVFDEKHDTLISRYLSLN